MNFLTPPFIISMLIALSVHEWAHAYAAWKLGDNTAKYEGRLTINPIAHLDPLGTLMFLIIGFGWGKPVPVDASYFRKPKRDTAIVAAAGPFSNLVLALIATVLLAVVMREDIQTTSSGLLTVSVQGGALKTVFVQVCASSLFINLALMAFNLLPIAPLDGSKILHPFIPLKYSEEYEAFMQRGPYFLLLLLILERAANISVLGTWVYGIIAPLLAVLMGVVSLLI